MGWDEGGWLCVAGAEGRAVVDVEVAAGSDLIVTVWVREGTRSDEEGRVDSAFTASNRLVCLSLVSGCVEYQRRMHSRCWLLFCAWFALGYDINVLIDS